MNININRLLLSMKSIKRYRYTGKERDEETGMYYHGARYYIPWLVRWASSDPLQGEMPEWSPYNYGYCNPITWTDNTGMQPDDLQQQITIPQGATLSGIAQAHGTTVEALLAANPDITDPDIILAGAQLNLQGGSITNQDNALSAIVGSAEDNTRVFRIKDVNARIREPELSEFQKQFLNLLDKIAEFDRSLPGEKPPIEFEYTKDHGILFFVRNGAGGEEYKLGALDQMVDVTELLTLFNVGGNETGSRLFDALKNFESSLDRLHTAFDMYTDHDAPRQDPRIKSPDKPMQPGSFRIDVSPKGLSGFSIQYRNPLTGEKLDTSGFNQIITDSVNRIRERHGN